MWKSYPDVTDAFLTLADNPSVVNDVCIEHIERFVVLLYDRTSTRKNVSDARKPLFDQKGRAPEAIPRERLLWTTRHALSIKLATAGNKR